MFIISELRAAVHKHRAYRRTVFELRGIPTSLAEDVNVYPGDEKRLARQAVYG